MDAKEEIRSRLNIEDVVGGYIELKRAGRNFKALSPFSQEKTPSFVVSPEKQIWHDFSSNRGGDVFSFVMEMEGVDFRGAMDILARKAGVDLSQYSDDRAKQLYQKKQRLYEATELAAKFYQFALTKSPAATKYWAGKRGFLPQTIAAFRLGYAPKDGSMHRFLLQRGFSAEELRAAGLLTQRSSGPGDMFRERMMVPLADGQGRVVGFTARLLGEQHNAPKYINTPQTLLYDKSRQVFGLHQAKEAIRNQDYAVVVEGNLDVIASHQAGEKAVVATAGTAMTKDHLGQLARLTPHIKLAFDGDKAGLAATERAIALAQEIGVNLSIITMPEDAKDPDELIQKDPALWRKAIAETTYALDWVVARYARLCDLATAEGKRQFTTKTLEVVQKLHDPVEQEHYFGLLATYVGGTRQAIRQKSQTVGNVSKPRSMAGHARHLTPVVTDELAYQDDLLAILTVHPSVRDVFSFIAPADFSGEHRQRVAAYLAKHAKKLAEPLPASLQNQEMYVKILLLKAEEKFATRSAAEYAEQVMDTAKRIKKAKHTATKQVLERQLALAEQQGQRQAADTLRQQLATLIKEQH